MEREREKAVCDPRFLIEFSKPVFQLHISGIPYKATEEQIRNLCEQFGVVVSAFIPLTRNGQSSGYAIVSYEREADGRRAIEKLDRTEWQGRQIFVEVRRKVDSSMRREEDDRDHRHDRADRHSDREYRDDRHQRPAYDRYDRHPRDDRRCDYVSRMRDSHGTTR